MFSEKTGGDAERGDASLGTPSETERPRGHTHADSAVGERRAASWLVESFLSSILMTCFRVECVKNTLL